MHHFTLVLSVYTLHKRAAHSALESGAWGIGESGAEPAGGAKPSVVISSVVKCRPQAAMVLISGLHVDTHQSFTDSRCLPCDGYGTHIYDFAMVY